MSAPQPRPWPPRRPMPPRRSGPTPQPQRQRQPPRTLRTLRAVRDDATAAGRPALSGWSPDDVRVSGLRRRAVGLARLLCGGLLVLAAVVALLPPVLGDPGPGAGAVLWHVVVALVAVGATVVAAGRRTSPALALGAALLVPAATVALLCGYWWA